MRLGEVEMRLPGTGIVVALGVALGASPGQAHHSDWGLPLVGGLVGGAGLTALYYNHKSSEEQQARPAPAQPVYVTPAAAPAVPSATTIEDKLNVLDQLAAKGYITPDQYKARRQALLDQL
jgi:hypothetical protein